MSEADFGFDEDEWKHPAKDDEEEETVTEVLKEIGRASCRERVF